MFDILVSPCDLMKNKSLELILKHLIYLEKHLYLLPFTAKTLKALFTTASPFPCLSIILQPLPPTHTHTLFLRPVEASLCLNLTDNMDAYAAFLYWASPQHLAAWVTPSSFSLLPLLSACHTLDFSPLVVPSQSFCCLLFDLHHLLLPVSEVSILVFFLFLLF